MRMTKVLVVDDSKYMRRILSDALTGQGYTVSGEAADGAEAAAMYREQRPDIVLMDIIMPGVDGIEGIHQILQDDPKAKVLVCSTMRSRYCIVEALKAGAIDYICKPFRPEQIVQLITSVLEN